MTGIGMASVIQSSAMVMARIRTCHACGESSAGRGRKNRIMASRIETRNPNRCRKPYAFETMINSCCFAKRVTSFLLWLKSSFDNLWNPANHATQFRRLTGHATPLCIHCGIHLSRERYRHLHETIFCNFTSTAKSVGPGDISTASIP